MPLSVYGHLAMPAFSEIPPYVEKKAFFVAGK
jgi:hypothetical protein